MQSQAVLLKDYFYRFAQMISFLKFASTSLSMVEKKRASPVLNPWFEVLGYALI